MMYANFKITADKIVDLQYKLLRNNVNNIISNSESDYKTISALGMEDIGFYRDATKKGVIQNINKNLTPGTSVVIFDSKLNEIIYLTGNEALGKLLTVEHINGSQSEKTNMHEHDILLGTGEKISTILASGQYPNWDWSIVSFVDKSQLLKYSKDAFKLSFIIAGIFIIIILILVFKLSNRISRAIIALENGAFQLSTKEANVKIELPGNDEFTSLASSFNFMAAEIRSTESKLLKSISDEKKTNLSLIDSRKQYHDLIEGMPYIITRVDVNGFLMFVNKAAALMLGLSAEDCIGKLAFDFIHPDDQLRTKHDFSIWLENRKGVFSHENRILNIDGQIFNIAWSIHGEYDEFDNFIGFASTGRDITEYVQHLEEKAKLESQLFQAQKMEAVGQLAGGIAHDFNNMLGVILGHAELALDKSELSSPLAVNLNGIIKAGKHSAELTKQLLTYARKQTIEPKIIDLNESISAMLSMLIRLIDVNIMLSFDKDANLGLVKIDPSQVDQILANLCVNASDAIEGFGKITIKTENYNTNDEFLSDKSSLNTIDLPSGNYVKLSVSDNGSGMNKEVTNHVFEPFYTTKEVGKGTGLGLSTIYGAVKQNNGHIDIVTELNQGTTFNIYFPREGHTELKTNEAKPDLGSSRNETILVVEDDKMLLDIQVFTLEEYGYTVLSAISSKHAEELARKHSGHIDMLLTDVIMPEINGKELAQKLLVFCPKMKVLYMSGYTSDIIADKGVICNDTNFIQKPFGSKALVAKVRDVLNPIVNQY